MSHVADCDSVLVGEVRSEIWPDWLLHVVGVHSDWKDGANARSCVQVGDAIHYDFAVTVFSGKQFVKS